MIILDVGRSMGSLQDNHTGMTGLDKAKSAFRLMVQQKLLFGYKQDVCGVLLFNSTKTENPCHDEYGGYDSIEEYFPLQTPNLDLLECIDNVQCNQNGTDGDSLDALLVAAQIIIKFAGKRKVRKRIFMMTDAATDINDVEQLDTIAESFSQNDISFNCIGIGFADSDDDDDDSDDESQPITKYTDIRGTTNKNEQILRFFARSVKGTVFTGNSAIKMMSDLRSKSVLLRPTYSGPLKITSKLSIRVKLFCRCREQTLPSLKKESAVGTETRKVQMDRLYKNKFRSEQDDEEVEEDERVKSYLYGKERVPFNENDEARLSYKSGEKHFECLGFIASAKVPRSSFMGPATVVMADMGKKVGECTADQYALSAFVRGCHEKGVCMLCRLVARKNAPPKLVVLQPRIKTEKQIFILNELPFYEDMRKYPFAPLDLKPTYVPSKAQIAACKTLIASLDLMHAMKDEDGDAMEALRPQQTFNPCLQRFYQNLQLRALDEQASLQPLDDVLVKTLEPDAELFNGGEEAVKQFTTLFPTKLIPKKQVKKERKHWGDINEELDSLFGDLDVDAKVNDDGQVKDERKKEAMDEDEDEEEDAFAMIGVAAVTAIGTKAPCKDFDVLLSKRNEAKLFETLSSKMWAVLGGLIDESYGDLNFAKALGCVKHLREASVREEEPLRFNEELRRFKAKYQERKAKLWRMMVEMGVTLIGTHDYEGEDVPDGLVVDKAESDAFLTQAVQETQHTQKVEVDSDDDDMDDLI